MFLDLERAHRHSIYHREEVLKGDRCGCFHCLAIFPSEEIVEWTDEGKTALCPKCGIDAVIGSASGLPIDKEFLKKMEAHWFGT